MAEITYKDLEAHLKSPPKEGFGPVYLIYGEEFLCKQAFDSLLDRLVPPKQRSFGYEPVDEDSEGIPDVIERLNTFSMMAGTKVVSLCDSRIFYSREDDAGVLKKMKAAFDKGDKKKAANILGSLLSLAELTLEDATTENGRETLKLEETFGSDIGWFEDLVRHIRDQGVPLKKTEDQTKILKDAVDKGFPKGHHLIVTTDIVDKRKALYTAIKEKGVVVDCSVPKGERKADKDAQDALLKDSMNRMLAERGKTAEPSVYAYLCELTGFDIRTFLSNLEKLIVYAGDRPKITVNDAKAVLKRTKQDPIFELSGAIAERNLENALFYTASLLGNGVFPLQVLATVTNQLRRLIIARDFLSGLPQGTFSGATDFNRFKSHVIPLIKDYDQAMAKRVLERETALAGPPSEGKKEKKIKAETDLILAKNPNNPYPVFLLLKNAGRYTMTELLNALEKVFKADLRLKSSGENPKLILDDLILTILRPMEKP